MPDKTDAPNHSHQMIQRIQDAKRRLNDIIDTMHTQRDLLRRRGFDMPTDSMDGLRSLRQKLDTLAMEIRVTHAELDSLRTLAETTAILNSSQSTEETLNQVMDEAISLTGAERGYIVLKNEDTGELEFKVTRGIDQAKLEGTDSALISSTVVNDVADSGEPILTDDASNDSRFRKSESIHGMQMRSILAVPLKVRDKIIGVVYVDNKMVSGMFREHEKGVLTQFANQAAVALENARLFEAARMRLQEVTDIRDRMRNLFRSIASGVITIDDTQTIIISNAAAHDIVRVDTMEGEMLDEVLPTMDDVFWDALATVRRENKQQTLDVEVTIDNELRYWTVIASPLRREDNLQGIAMVIDDVTEERTNQSLLTQARTYLPGALVKSMSNVNMAEISIEEREITAVFADVRGFTSFSENLEPEELMQVINKYLSLASDAINLFEGVVDKYMGDAVTGLYNTQLNPQTDHPRRAIQAALQLVLDLHAQHEVMDEDERLFYGIGIHTGPAVLGNVGGKSRKEFSALGEATDICKFLQEQAGPGEVVISEQTYERVQDDFECERLTELARPKAGYEHVICYKVLGRKEGTRSQFVDDELLELLGDLDEMAED